MADQGVEVSSAVDAGFLHSEVELIPCLSILLGVYEDREVAVVVFHVFADGEHADTFDVGKGFPISLGDALAGGDGFVNELEVEQAVGGAHFVHFGVDAGGDDFCLAGEAEVFEIVDALLGFFVVAYEGAAFDGVVGLGGVEGEGGHVAGVEDAFAIDFDAEGVGGVVDDAKAVAVGDLLDGVDVAGVAVDMHGHDGGGFWGDGGFNLGGVETAGGGVDVDEDGADAVPPEGVGGGHETIGGGDHFAGDAEGLQGGDEGEGAVGEEGEEGHAEVGGEGGFEAVMVFAVVGDPLAVPDVAEEGLELVKVGEEGGGHSNPLLIYVFLFHSLDYLTGVLFFFDRRTVELYFASFFDSRTSLLF